MRPPGSRSLGRLPGRQGLSGTLALDDARRLSPILLPRIGSSSIDGKARPILLVQQRANPLT